MRTFNLVVALPFLYFALCNADDKKPYLVKKSLLCNSDQDSEVCIGDKYNFYSVVKQIVDSVEKLSEKQKVTAKNIGVCGNAFKKAICSKRNQLCLDKNDDSGAKRVCKQLSEECPAFSKDSSPGYEEECVKYMQRQSTNLTCVNSDAKFAGYCPKPTSKMPATYLQAYAAKSKSLEMPMGLVENVNKLTGVDLLSKDCMKKIKNAVCVPLYCTEDKESIMVPNLQENCNDVLECINKASDKYEKFSSMLKPIKDRINKGCDKFIALVKPKSVVGVKNHSKGLGPELLIIAIALFVTYFN